MGIFEAVIVYMAEAGQSRAGTDRSKNEPLSPVARHRLDCFPRQRASETVDLMRLVAQLELIQCDW